MKTMIVNAVSVAAAAIWLNAPAPTQAQTVQSDSSTATCRWQAGSSPRAHPRVLVCDRSGGKMTGMGGPLCRREGTPKTARYEWWSPPSPGPRAPVRAPIRLELDDC